MNDYKIIAIQFLGDVRVQTPDSTMARSYIKARAGEELDVVFVDRGVILYGSSFVPDGHFLLDVMKRPAPKPIEKVNPAAKKPVAKKAPAKKKAAP